MGSNLAFDTFGFEMKAALLKMALGAILVLGFVLMRLDGVVVKFGDNLATASSGAANTAVLAAREHGAHVASHGWSVADIVRDLRKAGREINEWSVFYKAYFKSLDATIKQQDLSRWCAIDYRNGDLQADLEWRGRLRSLHRITFADLTSRGVSLPKYADDTHWFNAAIKRYFEGTCLAREAQRIAYGGYPQGDLDGLLAKHPNAEPIHAHYAKLMAAREEVVLALARKLAGSDANVSDFTQQARSQWVEMVGKPKLENLRQQQEGG